MKKKDSISKLPKEKREKLEQLRKLKVKIHEDKANNKMIMNYLIDFKKISELRDVQSLINNAESLEKGKDKSVPSKSETIFSFKRNKFKRTVIDNKLTKKEDSIYNNSMKEAAMFFEGSNYNLEYHFPRRIKSTTVKGATFSMDKKVMYIKKTFKEVIETPHSLDFEVILERN
jgi:hypothetical protein